MSDAFNVVKGRPLFLGEHVLEGRKVIEYRFRPFPAGGPYGSHTIAFVQTSPTQYAFASVHGDHLDASAAMAIAYAEQWGRDR